MAKIKLNQLSKEFAKMADKAEDKVAEGLNENAEDLLSQSIDLAPLDEGGLRESGSVNPAKKEGSDYVAEVGYNTEYALKMHEDFYKPSVAGTGRKYLEKPTHANSQKYNDNIAKKVGEAID